MKNSDPLKDCSLAMAEWLVLSTQISLRSHFMFFKKQGLSHSQISTLHMLYHKKEFAVNDVSHIHSISKPAASQLLDQLVKRGLVERYESSEDRRIKYHKLTPAGKDMMREGHEAMKDWYRSLIDDLPEDELTLVTDALDILNRKIRVYKSTAKGMDKGDRS